MNDTPPASSAPRSRPGAMTMAMQAVQHAKPEGPKVLRIGLLQGGKIVEERIVRARETVTFGPSERNYFVIRADGMPARFELFQLVGNEYVLNFTESMGGRVGLADGVHDLDQLRTSGAAQKSGDHWQLKLSDSSRGKVVLGDTTVLFQFVALPPIQPRPQLPAAARAGFVRGIDWLFTAHVTFSFMAMFAVIVYMENADWPIDDGIAAVPERLAKLIFEEPPPPPLPDQPVPDESAEPSETETAPEEAPTQRASREAPPSPGPTNPDAQRKVVAEQSARIAQEAAQAAEALIIGALSSKAGGVLADVLAGGAVTGNAEDVLAAAAGVGVAATASGGALRERSGGSGSGQDGDLGTLARAQGGTEKAKEGSAVQERAVRGRINLESGGDVGGAGDFDSSIVVRTIKTRLSAIQACYERELKRNPTLTGKVTVEFTIQERGNVTDARAVQNTIGDKAVADCVVQTVARFRFTPGPQGGSVTFSYPFVFAPQG